MIPPKIPQYSVQVYLQPTDKDYKKAEIFIKKTIGEEFKIAKTYTGEIVTNKCSQIWQDTFLENANNAFCTLNGRIYDKRYFKKLNVLHLLANLEKVHLCIGKANSFFFSTYKSY
jgi:hypothetical protein